MKKVLAIVAIAAFAASFTACKKEYTCDCTDFSGVVTVKTEKGKNAADACDKAENKLLGISLEDCVPQ